MSARQSWKGRSLKGTFFCLCLAIEVTRVRACVNDDTTSDLYGDTCSMYYDDNPAECFGPPEDSWDDDDFTASVNCCVCKGDSVSYGECTLVETAVLGSIIIPSLPIGTCCDSLTAQAMAIIARADNLPATWTTVAAFIGLKSCTVPPFIEDGACSTEYVYTADNRTQMLLRELICADPNCHANGLYGTGTFELFNLAGLVDEYFNAECHLIDNGDCVDTDNGNLDADGDSCSSWYEDVPSDCGFYDSDTFFAMEMCCVCSGGSGERDCLVPEFTGDETCDDENNVESCGWDGGDCCGGQPGWSDLFCDVCACLDPDFVPSDNDTNAGLDKGSCVDPHDLSEMSAPYSGNTTHGLKEHGSCGAHSAPESIFFMDLQPATSLAIWILSSNFDSQHSLRIGGKECPGDRQLICVDDPDSEVVSHYNEETEVVRVFFTVDGYWGSSSGDFEIMWEVTDAPVDLCVNAIDVATIESPYKGSTSTGHRQHAHCGSNGAPESIFYANVEPGLTFQIHQISNNFDSSHSLHWGGACPGVNKVSCVDDPDERWVMWENNQDSVQQVYFVLDGFKSDHHGDFKIEWNTTNATRVNGAECKDNVFWNDGDEEGHYTCTDYKNQQWCENCEEGEAWDFNWGALSEWSVIENCCESCGCGTLSATCARSMDLAEMSAPFQGTTTEGMSQHGFCGSEEAPEASFYRDVRPGETIVIRQTATSFDSQHSMRWGGRCPGINEIACVDEPDSALLYWFNDQPDTQPAFFMLDGYWGHSHGEFTLDWALIPEGANVCARGCPIGWRGDGICDYTCNTEACEHDLGDCASVSTGTCSTLSIGDSTFEGMPASFGPSLCGTCGVLKLTMPPLACDPIAALGALAGSDEAQAIADDAHAIAVILRGTCSFVLKAMMAQNAGAKAYIVMNNAGGNVHVVMGAGTDSAVARVAIPGAFLTEHDGRRLQTFIEEQVSEEGPSVSITACFGATDWCDPDCPPHWRDDGVCDHGCNTAACDYDGGDCEEGGVCGGQYWDCTGDEPSSIIMYDRCSDMICSESCERKHSIFDVGLSSYLDCTFDNKNRVFVRLECTDGKVIQRQYTDHECTAAAAEFYQCGCSAESAETSEWCAVGCPPIWKTDGICDFHCNSEECDFDGGDCDQSKGVCNEVYWSCEGNVDHSIKVHLGCEDNSCGECQQEVSVATHPDLRPYLACDYDAEAFVFFKLECRDGTVHHSVYDDDQCTVPVHTYGECSCQNDDADNVAEWCAAGCVPDWVDDGLCDFHCNNPECGYDGDDCLGEGLCGGNYWECYGDNEYSIQIKTGCQDNSCSDCEKSVSIMETAAQNYLKCSYIIQSNVFLKLECRDSKVTYVTYQNDQCTLELASFEECACGDDSIDGAEYVGFSVALHASLFTTDADMTEETFAADLAEVGSGSDASPLVAAVREMFIASIEHALEVPGAANIRIKDVSWSDSVIGGNRHRRRLTPEAVTQAVAHVQRRRAEASASLLLSLPGRRAWTTAAASASASSVPATSAIRRDLGILGTGQMMVLRVEITRLSVIEARDVTQRAQSELTFISQLDSAMQNNVQNSPQLAAAVSIKIIAGQKIAVTSSQSGQTGGQGGTNGGTNGSPAPAPDGGQGGTNGGQVDMSNTNQNSNVDKSDDEKDDMALVAVVGILCVGVFGLLGFSVFKWQQSKKPFVVPSGGSGAAMGLRDPVARLELQSPRSGHGPHGPPTLGIPASPIGQRAGPREASLERRDTTAWLPVADVSPSSSPSSAQIGKARAAGYSDGAWGLTSFDDDEEALKERARAATNNGSVGPPPNRTTNGSQHFSAPPQNNYSAPRHPSQDNILRAEPMIALPGAVVHPASAAL